MTTPGPGKLYWPLQVVDATKQQTTLAQAGPDEAQKMIQKKLFKSTPKSLTPDYYVKNIYLLYMRIQFCTTKTKR